MKINIKYTKNLFQAKEHPALASTCSIPPRMQIPQHPSTSHPFRDEQSLLSTQKQSLDSKNKIHLEIPFAPFLPTPPRLSSRKHLNF